MSTVIRHTRRGHKNSKQGCRICKDRHVRCDELRPSCHNCKRLGLSCRYADKPKPPTPATSSDFAPIRRSPQSAHGPDNGARSDCFQVSGPLASKKTVRHSLNDSPISPCKVLAVHGLPNEWSSRESTIMYHMVQQVTNMQYADGHALTLQTNGTPVFLRLSFEFDFARYATLCGALALLASSTAYVKKFPELPRLLQIYRTMAVGKLAEALNHFSEANADAILGTTSVLAHTSVNVHEHRHFEDGYTTILALMKDRKYETKYPINYGSPYALLHLTRVRNEALVGRKTHKLAPEVRDRILEALQPTKALLANVSTYLEAIQNMCNVLHIVSQPGPVTDRQQFQISQALRMINTVAWESLVGFGTTSLATLLYLSFLALISLIVEATKPRSMRVNASWAHAGSIIKIHKRISDRLAQGTTAGHPELFVKLMDVPYKIASAYLKCGTISLE